MTIRGFANSSSVPPLPSFRTRYPLISSARRSSRPSRSGHRAMPPRPSLARGPSQARRREIIPAQIRDEVVSCGKFLAEFFGSAFSSSPRLKYAVGRLLVSQLPPLPRPRGRPPFAIVTAAIRAREEAKRRQPERSQREIWDEVYASVIPNYHGLPPLERQDAQSQLRQRVRWRLSARRRRGKFRTDLSVL